MLRVHRAVFVMVLMAGLVPAVVSVATAAPPPTTVPNAALNAKWNTYGNQGGHWTGGDRTASVPLPDGRTAWLFSDTFLGTVNADGSRPANSPMVHNTIVVEQNGQLGPTLHGGTPAAPSSLVEIAGSSLSHWVADGIVEGNTLKVLYMQIESTGGGVLDLKLKGTALATFSLPSLSLTGVRTLPLGDKIAWGQDVFTEGGRTYVYGSESNGDEPKRLHLARTNGLDGTWEFWTGSAWSAREADSARLLTGTGTAFSVTKVGAEYVLMTIDGNLTFNPTLVAYTASAPTGPFGNPRPLYEAPEAGADGRPVIVYDATVHPQLGQNGTLVVSYNVNSLDAADTKADVRIYRPRFVDVTWPPPAPDPSGLPGAPGGLGVRDDNDGGATLSWQPVSGASYRVYQRDVTNGQEFFSRHPKAYTGTTAAVPFLRDGHTYEFRVTAQNANGEGPTSATLSLTVRVKAPEPPANLRAAANDSGGVALTWDRSTSPGLLWYQVFRTDVTNGPGTGAPVYFPDSGTPAVTDVDLEHDHVYEYVVVTNRSGQASAPSTAVRATARYAKPGVPANLRATPRSDGKISLSWDAPAPGVWYWVYQRDISDNPANAFTKWPLPIAGDTTIDADYLTHTHTYEFKVAATNRGGEGAQSAPVQATSRMAAPPAPTGLTAVSNGDGTVKLSWTRPPNTWTWILQRDVTEGDTEFYRWDLPVADSDTATAGYLVPGHTYEFKVAATNQAGDSAAFSNAVQVVADVAAPPPPADLIATAAADGTIGLKWTAPRDQLWYFVYQRDVTKGQNEFTKWPYPVTSGTTATAAWLDHLSVYEFKVTSAFAGKESAFSAPARATSRVQAPSVAPTGLSALARPNGSAFLHWNSVGQNIGYFVYQRDVTAGQAFFRWGLPLSATQAVADPLINGHVYEFRVAAANAGGEGPQSAPIQITAHGGTPAAPSLSVAPGDGRATLTWNSVQAGAYYFVHRRNVSAGEGFTKFPLPIQETSFADAFLINGDTYEYVVSASNEHGEGPWSNSVQVRPLPPAPAAPAWLTAAAGDGKVTLNWAAVSGAWYVVEYRDVTAGQQFRSAQTLSPATSWVHTYLTNGHTYEYRVRATNIAGDGPPTAAQRARPMPPFPSAPSGLVVQSVGDGTVNIAWQASPTPWVGYVVETKETSASSWRQLPANCCSHQSMWLTNAVGYQFRVRATNMSGTSASTNTVEATPMPPFPAAPWGVSASKGSAAGQINLSWSPSSTPNAWYWVSYRQAGPPTTPQQPWYEEWTTLPYPLPQTSITVTGLAWQEVYEFQVRATNAAGTSGRTSVPWAIAQTAGTATWRPANEANGSNARARELTAGKDCGYTRYQRVCYDARGFFSPDNPMTVGDYLLYNRSRGVLETQLRCEAIKRADIRKTAWPMPAQHLESGFPRFEEHERIHSDQWAQYQSVHAFLVAYGAASVPPPNEFEVGANLWWGGYRVTWSESPTAGVQEGCEWLYKEQR
ncbi:fibronectin type III domain-containing protein [Lentzea sp. NPDC034063]|uniref:fibronectin type III domain-containing protein n=1 Tax=unclassified Lentzea TaxID=2643253 RepID=UPI0033F44A2A